jgi:hypothetical protein
MSRWRHLTREEMGDYDFDMTERWVGSRFALVVYDYGVWLHPKGEEATMENAHEFESQYPPGYYWSGGDRSAPHQPGDPPPASGGPFAKRQDAQRDADRWLSTR